MIITVATVFFIAAVVVGIVLAALFNARALLASKLNLQPQDLPLPLLSWYSDREVFQDRLEQIYKAEALKVNACLEDRAYYEDDCMPPEELADIYRWAWLVEKSFRQFKYAMWLYGFDSRPYWEFRQQIHAKLQDVKNDGAIFDN